MNCLSFDFRHIVFRLSFSFISLWMAIDIYHFTLSLLSAHISLNKIYFAFLRLFLMFTFNLFFIFTTMPLFPHVENLTLTHHFSSCSFFREWSPSPVRDCFNIFHSEFPVPIKLYFLKHASLCKLSYSGVWRIVV